MTLKESAAAACAAVGIIYRDVPQDGRFHPTDIYGDRDGRGDGRIKLFPDGAGGVVVNWKGITKVFFRTNSQVLTAQERHEQERRKTEAMKAAKEDETRRRMEARKKAEKLLSAAAPAGSDHPYLIRKQVKPTETLYELPASKLAKILGYEPRSSNEILTGRILIAPVMIGNTVSTCELIDETGRKSAIAGGAKAGGMWTDRSLPDGDGTGITILIAEGIATALSAMEATGCTAVAALSCHNLGLVAAALQERFPRANRIVLADRGNGQSAAEEAARDSGACLAVPDFGGCENEGLSDFNDLHALLGLEVVRQQILQPDEEREAIQAECAEKRAARPAYSSVTPPDSFVSRYVNYARQRTDAPPESHELMAVGLLSALAGPKPRLPIATSVSGWTLTLWIMYVVNSTLGRKSSVINFAIDIATEVLGKDAVLFWEGSPQGIVQRLQSRDGQSSIFARDEYSGLLTQMNRAGGHMAGLAQMFIKAYDGGTLENIRTKKKNKQTGQSEDDTDRVTQPYLVKLCASTWDSLVMRATIDNVLDGFLARFIVYTGSAEPQQMKQATPELVILRQSLIDHAEAFHRKASLLENLQIGEDVLAQQWKLEQEWNRRAQECSRPDAAGPALKRLSESVLKVAGLLAIDATVEGEVPIVTVADFECAQKLGDRWINSTIALIEALGRNTFQQNCEAVLATIHTYPSGTRLRDVYRKHRKLTTREFNDVLTALQMQDEIIQTEKEAKSGPPYQFVAAIRRQS
jgi:phage/plasmid primase-like uncharacterized protein